MHTDSTSRNKDLYKKILDDQHYSFSKFLNSCLPTLEHAKKNKQAMFATYQLTRYYYSYIYQFLRDAPIRKKYCIYNQLHKLMKTRVPEYMQQTKRALKYKKVTRPYARKIALLSYRLERFHLMKVALLGYHLASKIYYFKV